MAKSQGAQVLLAAADLLEQPGRWGRGWFAKTKTGKRVPIKSRQAVRFCASGAIERVGGNFNSRHAARMALDRYLRSHGEKTIATWNDSQKSAAPVVRALRAAADARKGVE